MIIYKAVNRVNGKIYIGQTKYTSEERIKAHIFDSTILGKAITKWGLYKKRIKEIK